MDPQIAARLGFPTPAYTGIERERRWLCREVPHDLVRRVEAITDLYVDGTRLRLREARPTDGSAPSLRLSKKADVDQHTRLVTSIYLSEAEFAVLAASLPGARIRKLRHRLHSPPGTTLLVDAFQDALAGLFIAEAEFTSEEALAAFQPPGFAICEVTDDPRFTGGHLVRDGLPDDWQSCLQT